MWNFITDPKSGKNYPINSKHGNKLLHKYVITMIGGDEFRKILSRLCLVNRSNPSKSSIKFESPKAIVKSDSDRMDLFLQQLTRLYSNKPEEGGIYQGNFTKSVGNYRDSDDQEIDCRMDVIKSGLQKYIRRGNLEKSYQFLVLGYLFALSDKPKAKGIITNLINRIRVITLEDIGIGNYQIVEIVDSLLKKFYQHKDDWLTSLSYLMTIVKNLVESKKIRLASLVKSIYNVPISKSKPNFPHKEEYREIYQFLKQINPDLYNDNQDCLNKGKLCYFMTISEIYQGKDIKGKIENVWVELGIMTRGTDLGKSIEILKQWYDGVTYEWYDGVTYGSKKLIYPEAESNLPLFQAILLVLNRKEFPKETIPNIPTLDTQSAEDEVFPFLVDLLHDKPIIIDNYVLDMHTTVGRSRGSSRLDFADQGSLVTDPYYGKYTKSQVNKFLTFYRINKLIDDGVINLENYQIEIPKILLDSESSKNPDSSKETKLRNLMEIIGETRDTFREYETDIPLYNLSESQYQDLESKHILGQMPVGSKMETYIFRDYVVKGPYQLDNQKFQLNLKNTKALCLLENHYDIQEKFRSCLPWSFILEYRGKYYLVNKNMGSSDFEIEQNPNTKDKKKLEKLKQGDWTIITRGSMINRASEIVPDRELGIAITQHLYFRFILGIGDVPLVNILVTRDQPQLIVGIDMEEKPQKYRKHETRIDSLFERASKITKEKYQNYLKEIVTIQDSEIPNIITLLRPIYNQNELNEIKKNIKHYNSM